MTSFLADFFQSGAIISTDPHTLLIGWGKRVWMENALFSHQPQFYFPDFFFTRKHAWFYHEHSLRISKQKFHSLLQTIPSKKSLLNWQFPSKSAFREEFDALQDLFKNQFLKKAVPYTFALSSSLIKAESLLTSLKSCLFYTLEYPIHIYGFWEESEGILGATPEVLFIQTPLKGKWHLSTAALAGTVSDDFSSADSKKNLEEHQWVVKGILESLSPFGTPLCKSLDFLKFPLLKHLHTPIEMSLDSPLDESQVIQALHPTPALGAYPCSYGKTWLESYEKRTPRLRFGAPVGFKLPEESLFSCYVAIRNMQWQQGNIRLGAGCGIVSSSEFDEEWSEILLKLKSIKHLLDL